MLSPATRKHYFSDPEKLHVLNKITHSRIIEKIEKEIQCYRDSKDLKAIFIDAALLIEMKMYLLTDKVWLVTVDNETQLKRLMIRDDLTLEEATQRINSQMSLEQKKQYSDVVLDNSKDFNHLKKQVEDLYKSIFGGA